MAIVEILQLQLLPTLILFAIVRSFSLLVFLLDKNTLASERPKEDLVANLHREFVYYLIPWIMFVVAASFASNIITASSTNNLVSDIQSLESIIMLGNVFRYALMALFGFLSGILMDRVGRKTTITIGIIALGFGFALLGFLSLSETVILAYFFASGVAWGTFLCVFLVIPGDLSKSGSKELFYSLGTIGPLIILFSFSMIDATWMTNLISEISPTSFSQILSTILFLSIIPIMLAKETLTTSKKRKRKLKEHIEQVEKVVHSS